MNILNKRIVLKLNSNWQPIHTITVQKAIRDIVCESSPHVVFDIVYDENDEFYSSRPVTWDEWITLPVREYDFAIKTPHSEVRCPTVIMSCNFAKMPLKEIKLTNENIKRRDDFKCQYTGKRLHPKDATVDHIVPLKHGGANDWTNLVCCDKKVNHRKGSKLNDQAGLKLLRPPKKPLPVPLCHIVSKLPKKHKDWQWFIT